MPHYSYCKNRNIKGLSLLGFSILMIMCISLSSCASKKQAPIASASAEDEIVLENKKSNGMNFIPAAVIYKTNGDYNDNVPVALTPDKKGIQSYPAPTDLTANSTPIQLRDGWLLDRRGGVGYNTAFLKLTYDQYRALGKAPSLSELMDNIIPDAKVTAVRSLPITINEALANPQLAEKYIP